MPEAKSFHDTSVGAGASTIAPLEWQAAYFDAMSDALLAIEVVSGRIIGANPAFYRLLGYSEERLRGAHFSVLLTSTTTNPNTPVGRRFPLTGSVSESQVFRHADGSDVTCDILVTAVRNQQMELAVLHMRDARQRQARVDADRAALVDEKTGDSVRVMEQYMAHVSHEFRTPLAVILSSSSMLERYYARLSEDRRDEHFTRIQVQVKYLTNFMDNLRFLSRLNARHIAVRPDDTDAQALLQEMVNEVANRQPLPSIETMFEGRLDKLTFDGALWRRAITPILENAITYTHPDGAVHITLRAAGGMLETSISDNGPGLPDDYLKQPFEVFRRGENAREIHGGGLGLAIAWRVTKLLGGLLTFDTLAGSGTTFTLVVPVS